MPIDKIATLLVYIHAGLGGIALIAGTISSISKKGRKVHKAAGKVFFYSLFGSSVVALVITLFPNHDSVFLFCIGIFSLYMIISGYRALWYKRNPKLELFDKSLAILLGLVAISMIGYGFIVSGGLQILLFVFGAFCLWMSILDILLFRDNQKRIDIWLSIHISRMSGGFIASITAFIVVNRIFPGIWGWFLPYFPLLKEHPHGYIGIHWYY